MLGAAEAAEGTRAEVAAAEVERGLGGVDDTVGDDRGDAHGVPDAVGDLRAQGENGAFFCSSTPGKKKGGGPPGWRFKPIVAPHSTSLAP